jgi:hypothetical protein
MKQSHRGGVQTGLPLAFVGVVPGPQLQTPAVAAGTKEKDITLAQLNALRFFGTLQFSNRHRMTRLEPFCAAQARNIEQHSPSHDSVYISRDVLPRSASRSHNAGRPAVVNPAFVSNVAKRVDVSPAIPVNFRSQEIPGEMGLAAG